MADQMTRNHDNPNNGTFKAGAFLCPVCCVEYLEIEVDFEYEGTILHDVKMLRCPVCHEELFTPEQHDTIKARLHRTQK